MAKTNKNLEEEGKAVCHFPDAYGKSTGKTSRAPTNMTNYKDPQTIKRKKMLSCWCQTEKKVQELLDQ